MMQSKWLTTSLWALITITALGVIRSSYDSRMQFIELQELLKKSQAYDVEWGQLLIEKSTLQSYIGLEKVARDELKMLFPARNQMVIVQGDKP